MKFIFLEVLLLVFHPEPDTISASLNMSKVKKGIIAPPKNMSEASQTFRAREKDRFQEPDPPKIQSIGALSGPDEWNVTDAVASTGDETRKNKVDIEGERDITLELVGVNFVEESRDPNAVSLEEEEKTLNTSNKDENIDQKEMQKEISSGRTLNNEKEKITSPLKTAEDESVCVLINMNAKKEQRNSVELADKVEKQITFNYITLNEEVQAQISKSLEIDYFDQEDVPFPVDLEQDEDSTSPGKEKQGQNINAKDPVQMEKENLAQISMEEDVEDRSVSKTSADKMKRKLSLPINEDKMKISVMSSSAKKLIESNTTGSSKTDKPKAKDVSKINMLAKYVGQNSWKPSANKDNGRNSPKPDVEDDNKPKVFPSKLNDIEMREKTMLNPTKVGNSIEDNEPVCSNSNPKQQNLNPNEYEIPKIWPLEVILYEQKDLIPKKYSVYNSENHYVDKEITCAHKNCAEKVDAINFEFHILHTHSLEANPWKCPYCPNQYLLAQSLEDHLKVARSKHIIAG